MTSEAKTGKTGLPLWAKILIGLVIVILVGILAGSIGFFFLVKNIVQQAQSPSQIAHTTQQIADFESPLPEGYKFEAAFTLMNVGTVIVEHRPDNQTLTLISFPKKESDPKAFVDKISESGIASGKSSAKLEEVQSRGSFNVAGVDMPYVVGKMAGKDGKSFAGMVGCLVSPSKEKTILVYGTQPPGTQYNIDTTKKLLQAIKSF